MKRSDYHMIVGLLWTILAYSTDNAIYTVVTSVIALGSFVLVISHTITERREERYQRRFWP
jgi:hypothetical protein